MEAIATIQEQSAPVPPQIEPKEAKPRKISAKVRHAIELLLTGECKTQKAAAEKAKLTRERLCKALKEVHVATYLEQQTRVALSRSQAPAAATLIRLATDAASEHVQKDAAIHLLAMAGHKPATSPQVSVNVEIKAGYVIKLRHVEPEPMVDVSPKQLAHD